MITIILADDHPTTRAGLRAILGAVPDFQIMAEAQNGSDAMGLVQQFRPKILLLDLIMPGPRPAEVERWVRKNCPETITLILTAHDRDHYLAEMMKAGVAGYLTKDQSSEQLVAAIRRAAQGSKVFTENQYVRVLNWHEEVGRKTESLSARETEILKLMVRGWENERIAERLRIAPRTVAFHVTNIVEKLGVHSKNEAIHWVHQHLSDNLEELTG